MAKKKSNLLKVPKIEFDTKKDLSIYDYDTKIQNYYNAIKLHPNISETTEQLILSYHNAMVSEGLAKATQNKHLEVLFSLSKMIDNYEWKDITKQRVDDLVLIIMKKYADQK